MGAKEPLAALALRLGAPVTNSAGDSTCAWAAAARNDAKMVAIRGFIRLLRRGVRSLPIGDRPKVDRENGFAETQEANASVQKCIVGS